MQYQILLAAGFAAVAQAQTIVTSSGSSVAPSTTESQVMPPSATAGFDPNAVNTTLTFNWCLAQQNTCPQICGGVASRNLCDDVALTYDCVCANGTVPDVTAFAQTLPFYICQQTFIQCQAAHPDDAQAKAQCSTNEVCGTRNATAEAIALTSAQAGPSSTASGASGSASSALASASSGAASASSAGSASASAASASATDNVGAFTAQQVGTGAFAAVLLAVFKLMV